MLSRRAVAVLLAALLVFGAFAATMVHRSSPRAVAAQLCLGLLVGGSEPEACIPLP